MVVFDAKLWPSWHVDDRYGASVAGKSVSSVITPCDYIDTCGGESTIDELDVLRSRFDVVDAVRSGPRQKPELEAELCVSRSTVDRAVRELESTDLLTRVEEGYTVTLYGELLAEHYETYVTEAEYVANGRALLAELSPEVPIDTVVLSGAEITHSGPPAAHQPITHFEHYLEGASRVRGFLRTITQSTTPEIFLEQAHTGLNGELILTAELTDYVLERQLEPARAVLEMGFAVFEVESLPYGLIVLEADEEVDEQRKFDAIALLFVYDEANDLLGLIVNDSPAAVAWAEAQYLARRERATEITDRFFDD